MLCLYQRAHGAFDSIIRNMIFETYIFLALLFYLVNSIRRIMMTFLDFIYDDVLKNSTNFELDANFVPSDVYFDPIITLRQYYLIFKLL